MSIRFKPPAAPLLGIALLLASTVAAASSPAQVVVQSTDFGTVNLPFTSGFNFSLAPIAAGDGSAETFVSDYGFTLGSSAALSGAVVTYDLSTILQLSDISVTLLEGTPFAGTLPTALTDSQVADRDSRILFTGAGDSVIKSINRTLEPGSYVLEISGVVTGSSGGSYGGVLNVASVPEPAGLPLALAGLGFLAVARRRARRA